MPRYQITDPKSGRTVTVEGDTPPTDDDADEIFSNLPAPTPEPTKPAGAPQWAQTVADIPDWAKTALASNPITAPLALGSMAVSRQGGKLGDVATEVIPAIAGTAIGGFGGPGGAMAGGAAGAGVGNFLAQTRRQLRGEQDGVRAGELAISTGMGALPLGKLKGAAGVAKVLGTRTFQGGALGAGSEVLRQAIDEPSYDWGKIGQSGAVGAGLGLVLGAPEAITLRKAFGGAAPLEGKTLNAAIEQIAQEQNIPATKIQEAINANTIRGKTAADSAEVFQKQVAVKSAQDSAEAILAAEAARMAEKAQAEIQAFDAGAGFQAVDRTKLSSQAQRMMDEYGGVNPAVLMPIASAAMGGTAGAFVGDTPEERVRNALIGAGVGAVTPRGISMLISAVKSSPAPQQVVDAAMHQIGSLRKMVAPQSFLPKEIKDALRFGEQGAAAVTGKGMSLVKDLESAIEGTGGLASQGITSTTVQKFLTGKIDATQLPGPVRTQAERVRFFIDGLSDRAISEGVVDGKLAETFTQNTGSYLRRSYDIFLNPNFKPDPAKVQSAITAVASSGKMSAQEAEAVVARMLDKGQRASLGDFMIGSGKIGGKDVSSLIKREDLLPEVKAMLGEIQDPIVNASQTIPRLAKLVEMHAAQVQAGQAGQKLGIFSPIQSLEHPSPIVAEGSKTHNVLAGLYAKPEIADALQREASSGRSALVPDLLWKGLTTATSVAKAAKTVWNPISYAPNLVGGLVSNLANGNFRLSAVKQGLILGAEELGALRSIFPKAPVRAQLTDELAQLRRMGVLGESVVGRDIQRTIEDSFWSKLSDPATKALSVPSKIYGGIDDFTRYLAYKSEVARYTKALPGATQEQVQRVAGETVRDTMPTYSAIPKAIKQLSAAGISPQFVNFTWETFRNTVNTARIGTRDLKAGLETGNKALAANGARRLAALTTVVGLSSGAGIAKMSKDNNKVTDDQDRALRYFSAPWNRDGVLQYHTSVGGGMPVSVSNLSYIVPQALLFEGIEAGRLAKKPEDAIPEFIRALGKQFGANPTKDSIVISSLVGGLTGRDPTTGREIPKTDITPTAGDRAGYMAEKAFKPLVLDFIEQTRKAIKGEQGDFGRVYTTGEQAARLAGIRQTTLDPHQAVKWKLKELSGELTGAGEIYRTRQGRVLSPEQNEKFYQDAEQARQRVFAELQTAKGHAEQLGIGKDEFIDSLKAAHVPPALIHGMVSSGLYTPLSRDKNQPAAAIAEALYGKPGEEQRAELARIHLEEGPYRTKAVISDLKDKMRDAARKVTPEDKLIRSMGTENGERADYISRQLEKLQTTEERARYIAELRAKGIITPQVQFQMTRSKPGK